MTTNRTATPLGAGLRSVLLPGWGQLHTPCRRFGAFLILVSIGGTAGLTALALSIGPIELLARLADPDVLLILLAINAVVAALRLTSVTHAWWARRGRGLFVSLTLVVLVLAPHAAVAWAAHETRQTLLHLFTAPASPQPAALAPATTRPVNATTTTTSPTTTTIAMTAMTATTPPGQFATDMTVPAVTTPTLPFNGERINLLLLGGDAGPGRGGLRTDSIIVASIDPVSGDVALFGMPRNYGGFTFSDGSPYPGSILNSVYGWGRRHPDAFGGVDPGASATTDVIEHITGLEIDHFLLVDLTGFAYVVDALGGVDITVGEPVYGPLYDPVTGDYEMIWIPAGEQGLTGGEALAYSRARYGSSDYARMARQRCVLTSLLAQSDAFSLLVELPDLLDVLAAHVRTDLPVDTVPDLIRLLPRVDAAEARVIGFDQTWRSGRTPEGYAIPDVDRIRKVVSKTLHDPSSVSELGVDRAADAC